MLLNRLLAMRQNSENPYRKNFFLLFLPLHGKPIIYSASSIQYTYRLNHMKLPIVDFFRHAISNFTWFKIIHAHACTHRDRFYVPSFTRMLFVCLFVCLVIWGD